MSEPAFTPGPWLVTKEYDHRDDVIFAVEVEGGQRVCDLMTDFPEDAANAHLIAAAPDLLENLENALPILDDAHQDAVQRGHSDPHWQHVAESLRLQCEAAREAINKAKGIEA